MRTCSIFKWKDYKRIQNRTDTELEVTLQTIRSKPLILTDGKGEYRVYLLSQNNTANDKDDFKNQFSYFSIPSPITFIHFAGNNIVKLLPAHTFPHWKTSPNSRAGFYLFSLV